MNPTIKIEFNQLIQHFFMRPQLIQVWEPSRWLQRGGVVWISRRAHNPEIDGSNPSLATLIHEPEKEW